MAAFGSVSNRPLSARGPSPGFRFTLYAILAIVLMFFDQRGGWLEQARAYLMAVAYPVQVAVNTPAAAWNWVEDSAETRAVLREENERLRARLRELEVRTLRYEALARENAQLRGLRDALPPVAERYLAAELVNVELNSLRQRALINRGSRNGVFRRQAVLTERGILGQTQRVGPWSAEIILVTDPEHAIPVQIERTGVRTIAVGDGTTGSLALPYLPGNADIQVGDLLVASGLGGVFPAGYPVARVTEVHQDTVQPLAQVRAAPLASIESEREVMLVWFREGHPAAPVDGPVDQLTTGNPALQPLPAPPRPPGEAVAVESATPPAEQGSGSAAPQSAPPAQAAASSARAAVGATREEDEE